jgi:hypothetical protein
LCDIFGVFDLLSVFFSKMLTLTNGAAGLSSSQSKVLANIDKTYKTDPTPHYEELLLVCIAILRRIEKYQLTTAL